MSNSSLVVSLLPAGPSPNVAPLLGPLLIGGLLALALWGVICVQIFTYFMDRPRDRVVFRATIAGLWSLDTFGSALIIYTLYHYMVINFMNPSAIGVLVWSDIIFILQTATSDFIIRTLFIYKIYQLSKQNVWPSGLLLALSSLALATGIGEPELHVLKGKGVSTRSKAFIDIWKTGSTSSHSKAFM
ncbi:hypothetical protein APHAL10511_005205 [Amanita phalloides]|nr:hypothetical protein APHAL10511_005205 [Amanita phalloides]